MSRRQYPSTSSMQKDVAPPRVWAFIDLAVERLRAKAWLS
jgi:hypothetical protein